jgi:uncharacterized protein (TIGR00255 family)
MALHSMTGFAREAGVFGEWHWAWEVRSVNGRGFDLKLRLPPGADGLSEPLRRLAAERFSRGTMSATLSAQRQGVGNAVTIDEILLDRLVEVAKNAASRHGLAPPSIGSLLLARGVIDNIEAQETDEERAALHVAFTAGFARALEGVAKTRAEEGARLETVLVEHVAAIARLTDAADASPARQPEAVRQRLERQVRELLGAAAAVDSARLHQEAVMLASRADIREEIDRLRAHVAAARELIGKGGAVGRRLDFLAQEFGREANTLTAKANDASVSRIGLELKTVVEQWREQVQNVE